MRSNGLKPAASWVRSRRALALSLSSLQGFGAVGARSEAQIWVSFRPFRLGSGQRDEVYLARSPDWPSYACRLATLSTNPGSDEVHRSRPGAHLLLVLCGAEV